MVERESAPEGDERDAESRHARVERRFAEDRLTHESEDEHPNKAKNEEHYRPKQPRLFIQPTAHRLRPLEEEKRLMIFYIIDDARLSKLEVMLGILLTWVEPQATLVSEDGACVFACFEIRIPQIIEHFSARL